ncbi:MAG: tail fiber protein [Planctomycetes bacterium]|nr:tail fiber protein [Planctomycetota bacterium]
MLLPFQGRLLMPSGEPLGEGTVRVLFSIYEAPTGGAAAWSSGEMSVQVARGGMVNVLLGGAERPLADLFAGPVRPLYLGVRIDDPRNGTALANEPEMLPRAPVLPALSAYTAQVSETSRTLQGFGWNAILVGGATDPTAAEIRGDRIEESYRVPPGAVVAFAGTAPPPGWLLCDGSEVSREEHARLFGAIGVAHGAGNGSTTFNLPDYRGRFLRGVDTTDPGSGDGPRDADRQSRSAMGPGGNTGGGVGTIQADATRRPNSDLVTDVVGSHAHAYSDVFWAERPDFLPGISQVGVPEGVGSNSGFDRDNTGYQFERGTLNAGEHAHRVAAGGDRETRPVNAYVNFIIKT